MKKDIHPAYEPVVFRDSTTGDMFLTRSTRTSVTISVRRDAQRGMWMPGRSRLWRDQSIAG